MHRVKRIVSLAAVVALAGMLGPGTDAYSLAGGTWASMPVAYYVNASTPDVSAAAATSSLQDAMNTWNTSSGTVFRFSYAGQVNDTSTALDRRNVIIFRNESNGSAIASTYSWSQNGERIDSDVVFWDSGRQFFAGSSGCASGAYIQDIATHEMGHTLGLGHSTATDATMYPSYSSCSTSFRTLSADDIAGAKSLYPNGTSGNTVPTVVITAPTSGTSVAQGTSLTFSGTATDSQDGALTSGIAWSSSIDGAIGAGGSVSKVLSPGSHVITAKVTDAGGLSATQQISVTVAATSNTAPTISISSPASGTSIAQGAALTFSGTASDTQNGNITAQIAWTSSIDGSIGTGGSFSKVLSAGSHVVTAKVTDSGGLTASKQVSVTVTSTASVSGPTLSARGYKVKGNQAVDLTWSNLTATSVDVYRSGSKIMTTGNDGAATDNINKKGGGSYTYKVCAAGSSSTCSNQASVTF